MTRTQSAWAGSDGAPVQEARATTHPAKMKLTVAAGAIGTVIEYFDFGIYTFLATTLAANFFPKGDPTAGLLYTFAVFGVAFVVRPLGGIWLGHVGDRRGRRFVLALSVSMMALATALIGLLPRYEDVGLWAPALLVVLRCVQGFSAGGEVGSAVTYVAEVAPTPRRGFFASTPQIGTLLGTMLASFAVALVSSWLSKNDMGEWGWRVPFLISVPLGIVGLLIRYRLAESTQFVRVETAGKVARVPFLSAIRKHPRELLTVFCMSLMSFASYYLVFTYLSTHFQRQGWMSASEATLTSTITILIAAMTLPAWGALSDRIGRKPLLLTACLGNLMLAYPAFVLMATSKTGAVAAQIMLGQFEAIYLSVLLTTYCEIFPIRVRLSGINLGHNLAALLSGGLSPYIATWLIAATGSITSPAWLLVGTAAVSACAALSIKETSGQPLPNSD